MLLQPHHPQKKVTLLNDLSVFHRKSNPDTAIIIANTAYKYAKRIDWQKGISMSLSNMAIAHRLLGNYNKALPLFQRAIEIDSTINNNKSRATNLDHIGILYKEQANYIKAIQYYQYSLSINKRISNQKGIANNYNNMANVYANLNEVQKAIHYYTQAMKIDSALKDKTGLTKRLGNLGNVFYTQKKYNKALVHYKKALRIAEEIKDSSGIAADLGNIANVYYDLKDHPQAFYYYRRALETNQKIDNLYGVSINLGNLASLYTIDPNLAKRTNQNKSGYEIAAEYLFEALAIDKQQNNTFGLLYKYEKLSTLFETSTVCLKDSGSNNLLTIAQMREKSLVFYKRYIELRSKIFDEENQKKLIQLELQFKYDQKHALDLAQNEQQRMQLYFVSGALALILVFAVIIFFSWRKTFRQKSIIEKSNHEKDILLKEIHHRVKNNMQIISSLLNLQTGIIKDEKALLAIQDAKIRVQSMALVHQKLYQSDKLSTIDFEQYFQQLFDYLYHTYSSSQKNITSSIAIRNIQFDIDTAVPLGLIVTELLTNSFKYAFKNESQPHISVSIVANFDNSYTLTYSDNGTGLPPSFTLDHPKTLGIELVNLLVDQLNGSVKAHNKNGAVFEITFKRYST